MARADNEERVIVSSQVPAELKRLLEEWARGMVPKRTTGLEPATYGSVNHADGNDP